MAYARSKSAWRRCALAVSAGLSCAATLGTATLGIAQLPGGTPAAVAPRSGAGYVLRDGSIQIVAAKGTKELIEALDRLFVESHPGVRFTVREGDNYSGMATLTFDTTAFAPMTSEYTRIGLGDNLKIAPEPTGFRIAHGSLNPSAALSPLALIVHKSNPLETITLDQMTRLFAVGAGGGDLTRWEELGVAGALAHREIRPCGPPESDYFDFEDPQAAEFLSLRKMSGLSFNHAYEGLGSYAEVVSRVAADPAAICIVALNRVSGGEVKVLGVSGMRAGTPWKGSEEDLREGRYALDRFLYIYLRSNKGMRFDPFAAEYMRVVLSPAGQRVIAASRDGYIPLNAREAADELAKLAP